MYAIRATYLPREDMHFDSEYYVKNHLALARSLLDGRIKYIDMHAEFEVRELMQGETLYSPCIMVLLVETEDQVERFREFMRSEHVLPLVADLEHYTNCEARWSVSEVAS